MRNSRLEKNDAGVTRLCCCASSSSSKGSRTSGVRRGARDPPRRGAPLWGAAASFGAVAVRGWQSVSAEPDVAGGRHFASLASAVIR